MCFFKKPKETKLAPAPAPPEKPAEPADVGDARAEEDEALFGEGGVPDLRIDRSTTEGGAVAGGSGLNMM